MFIAIHDLEQKPVEFDVALPPGAVDFGSDIKAVSTLAAKGVAELLREEQHGFASVLDIRLRGNCATKLELVCSRCLEPVPFEVNVKFDQIFRPLDGSGRAGEHSISEGETEIDFYSGDGIELEDALKEQVLLNLPSKPLCREECRGLCVHCGSNLNVKACGCKPAAIDPRWEALAGVKEKLKK